MKRAFWIIFAVYLGCLSIGAAAYHEEHKDHISEYFTFILMFASVATAFLAGRFG